MQNDLLLRVKSGITDTWINDVLLECFFKAAVLYSECYQRLPDAYYSIHTMNNKTEEAITKLTIYFYNTKYGYISLDNHMIDVWKEANALLRS